MQPPYQFTQGPYCPKRSDSPLPVLQAMQALLAAPGTWCQGTAARNVLGQPAHPCAASAVAWDVVGAWVRVTQEVRKPVEPSSAPRTAYECLCAAADGPLGAWNDRPAQTQAAVVAWLAWVMAQARAVWGATAPAAALEVVALPTLAKRLRAQPPLWEAV